MSLLSYGGFCQDTLFYDADWLKLNSNTNAEYYKIVTKDQADTNIAEEKTYYRSGQIRQEDRYINYASHKLDGVSKTWYKNGRLKAEAHYKDGKLEGSLRSYWDNGQRKREDVYESGKLTEGHVYNLDGTEAQYYEYEIMAQYPGGLDQMKRYLTRNIKYPKKARKQGISGKVLLKFYVDTDGSIQNVKVEKGVSEELDQEAIRVVKKMPRWQPGRLDGEKVKTYYILPLNFRIT